MSLTSELQRIILTMLAMAYSTVVARTCHGLYNACNGPPPKWRSRWTTDDDSVIIPAMWMFGTVPLGTGHRIICPPCNHLYVHLRRMHACRVARFAAAVNTGGIHGFGAVSFYDNDIQNIKPDGTDLASHEKCIQSYIGDGVILDDRDNGWQHSDHQMRRLFCHVTRATVNIRSLGDRVYPKPMGRPDVAPTILPAKIHEVVLRRGLCNSASQQMWVRAAYNVDQLLVFDCDVQVIIPTVASLVLDVLGRHANALHKMHLVSTYRLCDAFLSNQTLTMGALVHLEIRRDVNGPPNRELPQETESLVLWITQHAPNLQSVTLTGFNCDNETVASIAGKVDCLIINL